MKNFKVIGDFISTFITAMIAFIAVSLVVINMIGWHLFSIDSSSMYPAYPVNSLVIVENVEDNELQIGDVITFQLNDSDVLVTHRIVDIDYTNQTITTKGDANNTVDASTISYSEVIGKVILGIPLAGGILRIITASENRIFIIGCIVVLFMFSFIWDMIVKKKMKEGRKTGEE